MKMKDIIREKLTRTLAPESIKVIDESHHHAGHSGSRPGGETHFRVLCVSEKFAGKSRVARHRLVNEALADELATTVHALALELRAPGE